MPSPAVAPSPVRWSRTRSTPWSPDLIKRILNPDPAPAEARLRATESRRRLNRAIEDTFSVVGRATPNRVHLEGQGEHRVWFLHLGMQPMSLAMAVVVLHLISSSAPRALTHLRAQRYQGSCTELYHLFAEWPSTSQSASAWILCSALGGDSAREDWDALRLLVQDLDLPWPSCAQPMEAAILGVFPDSQGTPF